MRKYSPIIVSFIGPVGVGKSTQMHLLADYFKSRNRKTCMTYIKSAHGFTNLLSKLLFNRITDGFIKEKNWQKYSIQKAFSPLWNLFDTINIIFKFLVTVYIPYSLGYNIIIEEGLNMSIANYITFRPYFLGTKPTNLPFLDLLLNWINSNKHLNIVINATDYDLEKRRKSRTFRQSESEEYVKLQRATISKLRGSDVLTIDTSGKSTKEVNKIIIDFLNDNNYLKSNTEVTIK